MARVLVVDGWVDRRKAIGARLGGDGHAVTLVADAQSAIPRLKDGGFDFLVVDVAQEDVRGKDVVGYAHDAAIGATPRIIEMSPDSRAEDVVSRVPCVRECNEVEIVGESNPIRKVKELIAKVAEKDTDVLITGESGTGKELVARAIHLNSARRAEPFVPLNCGAIPDSLIESELFGYAKGSHSEAKQDRKGVFEAANGGILFLDEVGELAPKVQVKLLRALQERMIKRLGDPKERRVNVRVIAATNKVLAVEVRHGRFREDLYYRIKVIEISLPSLRERSDDIPLLAEYFFQKYVHELNLTVRGISPDAIDALRNYRYPGNVRELANIIKCAVTLESNDLISMSSLPQNVVEGRSPLEDFVTVVVERDEDSKRRSAPSAMASDDAKAPDNSEKITCIAHFALQAYEAVKGLGVRRSSEAFKYARNLGLDPKRHGVHNDVEMLRRTKEAILSDFVCTSGLSDECRTALYEDIVARCRLKRKKHLTQIKSKLAVEQGPSPLRPEPSAAAGAVAVVPNRSGVSSPTLTAHPHRLLERKLRQMADGGGNNHVTLPATPGLLLDRVFDALGRAQDVRLIKVTADDRSTRESLVGFVVSELQLKGVIRRDLDLGATADFVRARIQDYQRANGGRHPRVLVVVEDIDLALGASSGAPSRLSILKPLCSMGVPVIFTSIRPLEPWCIQSNVSSPLELRDVALCEVADDWESFAGGLDVDAEAAADLLRASAGSPALFELLAAGQEAAGARRRYAWNVWLRLRDFHVALLSAAAGRFGGIPQDDAEILRWARVLHASEPRVLDPELAAYWPEFAETSGRADG